MRVLPAPGYRAGAAIQAKDRIDEQWFWSENHRLIVLTNEYLAGQRFFIRGLTAAEAWSARQSPVTNKKFASSVDIC